MDENESKPLKRYRVGDQKFYRDGVTYPPGSVVTIPANQEPSITWTPLDDEDGDESEPAAADEKPKRRKKNDAGE